MAQLSHTCDAVGICNLNDVSQAIYCVVGKPQCVIWTAIAADKLKVALAKQAVGVESMAHGTSGATNTTVVCSYDEAMYGGCKPPRIAQRLHLSLGSGSVQTVGVLPPKATSAHSVCGCTAFALCKFSSRKSLASKHCELGLA